MNNVKVTFKPGLIGGAALCVVAGSVLINTCIKLVEYDEKAKDRKRLDDCLKGIRVLDEILKKTDDSKEETESVVKEEEES